MVWGKPENLKQWVSAKKLQRSILGEHLQTCSICQKEINKTEKIKQSKDGSIQHVKCIDNIIS